MTTHNQSKYLHDLEESSFRLMRFVDSAADDSSRVQSLRFHVINTPLNQAPAYYALSYRWDDDQAGSSAMKIFCNDVEVEIGPNLYSALLQLSTTSERAEHIWIDYICINQDDLKEKQQQMLRMTEVYSNAAKVILWLGTADISQASDIAMESIKEVVETLSDIDKNYNRITQLPMTHDELIAKLAFIINLDKDEDTRMVQVWHLFQRSWFGRVWTLQEAALSDNCIMMCGNKTLEYSVLQHFTDRVMNDDTGHWLQANKAISSRKYGTTDPKNPPRPILMHNITVLRMRRILNGQKGSRIDIGSLVRVLNMLRLLDSTDPIDRIFSVSAFLPPRLVKELRGNAPVLTSNLYIRFAEILMQDLGAVQCLAAAGLCQQRKSYPLRYHDTTAHSLLQLPSWVPDWTFRKINEPFWILDIDLFERRGHRLFQAATSLNADIRLYENTLGLQTIITKAIILDNIAECGEPWRVPMLPPGCNVSEDTEAVYNMYLEYKTQVENYITLAQSRFRQPEDISAEDRLTIIRQTIIAAMVPVTTFNQDQNSLWIRSQPEHINPIFEDLEDMVKMLRQIADSKLKKSPVIEPPKSIEEQEADRKKALERRNRPNITTALSVACKGRRFFTTADGNIGLGPDLAQSGDRICVVHGACTPFVVRPVPPPSSTLKSSNVECYQLVGECYLHGVMDGEVLGMEGKVSEDIYLV